MIFVLKTQKFKLNKRRRKSLPSLVERFLRVTPFLHPTPSFVFSAVPRVGGAPTGHAPVGFFGHAAIRPSSGARPEETSDRLCRRSRSTFGEVSEAHHHHVLVRHCFCWVRTSAGDARINHMQTLRSGKHRRLIQRTAPWQRHHDVARGAGKTGLRGGGRADTVRQMSPGELHYARLSRFAVRSGMFGASNGDHRLRMLRAPGAHRVRTPLSGCRRTVGHRAMAQDS